MKTKLLSLLLALMLCLSLVACGASDGGASSDADTSEAGGQSTETTETGDTDTMPTEDPAPVEEEQTTEPEPADASQTTEVPETDDQDTTSGEAMTEDTFNQIENGMTYDEVIALIGAEGELVSESEIDGITTAMYQWDAGDYGVVMITFQDDTVVNISQMGVSEGSDVVVTADMYAQIKEGMTYEEVVEIFGGDGVLISDTELAGSTSQIYQWNGESLGANCMITFSDGTVFAMSQVGIE